MLAIPLSLSLHGLGQQMQFGQLMRREFFRIRITLAFAAVAISFTPAWPWGNEGHRSIGMVADLLLANAPAARDAVSQILGGVSLSEAAVFADCAKGPRVCQRVLSPDEQDYVQDNPQHAV